jgi:hypothetical protein
MIQRLHLLLGVNAIMPPAYKRALTDGRHDTALDLFVSNFHQTKAFNCSVQLQGTPKFPQGKGK